VSLNQTAFVTMATAGGADEQVLALMVAVGIGLNHYLQSLRDAIET
jgi:hypothetical protein